MAAMLVQEHDDDDDDDELVGDDQVANYTPIREVPGNAHLIIERLGEGRLALILVRRLGCEFRSKDSTNEEETQ